MLKFDNLDQVLLLKDLQSIKTSYFHSIFYIPNQFYK